MSLGTCALLFFLAFVFELTYTAYTRAVATNRRLVAIVATAALPWVGFFEFVCLIEAETLGERLVIGGLTSAGFACGTALVLYLLPRKTD